MKQPPFIFDRSCGLITGPIGSPICNVVSGFINLNRRSWICTQKEQNLNSSSEIGLLPSNRCKMTRCQSYDHGSPSNTFSASTSSLNVNSFTLFPMFVTSKLTLVRHSGRKVRTIASIFNDLFVKNFAANTWFVDAWDLVKITLLPSFANKDNRSHLQVNSSILKPLNSPTQGRSRKLNPTSN